MPRRSDPGAGEDDEDDSKCREHFREAERYLTSFRWCSRIEETCVGYCVGGIITILLMKILPARDDADEWIWVIVGDLPRAYIAPAEPRPAEALEDYIFQMRRWVDAAKQGKPVGKLIPVNVAATPEWAAKLESRLDFLEREILPEAP